MSHLHNGKPKSVIDTLRDIANATTEEPEEKISIIAFSKGLGRRSYGILLLTFNLPNLIPLPLPLLSIFFGVPLAVISLQLVVGFERPWLPKFLSQRGITKTEMLYFCDQADMRYGWVHQLIHPRLPMLTHGITLRLIGLVIFILASAMVLPIPLGNLVLAIPIAILALGLIERDGVFIICGIILGCIGLFFNLFIGYSIFFGLLFAYGHLFNG